MLSKSSPLLSIFAVVILLSSCGKYPCSPSTGLRLAFVSYTEAETDTVILKQYVKGSQFNTVMDSLLIDTTVLRFVSRNDTLFPAVLLSTTLMISQYDYRVYLPAVNRTYNITDIVEEKKYLKRGFLSTTKEGCGNPITSYALDGQLVADPTFYEVAYLKK